MNFRVSRREALKNLAAAAAASTLGGCAWSRQKSAQSGNPVARENALPGTRDWMLTNTRVDPATKWRCPWIEGYCSHSSVRAGEELTIFVSTNPAAEFTLEIYRLGHYGGAGGRLLRTYQSLQGRMQPDPVVGAKRVRDCLWEPSVTFRIPDNWVSGVHLGKLTELRSGVQSYVTFIVRDDRRADFLFQCSDFTWQAYNR